jgi:hypothetical protein
MNMRVRPRRVPLIGPETRAMFDDLLALLPGLWFRATPRVPLRPSHFGFVCRLTLKLFNGAILDAAERENY